MRDTLLEYVMKVDAYAPVPAASAAYIRKALVLVKPLSGGATGTITECTDKASVELLTESKCYKMLEAGMSSILVLPTTTLNVADILQATTKKFFTIIIDPAFDNSAVSAYDYGSFSGVSAWCAADKEQAATFSHSKNNVGFYDTAENSGVNMFWAFGKLLSANTWKNQQYIEMPASSGIDTIDKAELMFDESLSFVLSSEEYSNRLALFASNKRAIIAPYVYEEITLKMQSKAVQYISLNEPNYTEGEASLLEDSLQGVINNYINDGIIESGSVVVELTNEQFVVKATIKVAEPRAMWRIRATMQQGDI